MTKLANGTTAEVTKARDSRGKLRPDWFASFYYANGDYHHFTGFQSQQAAADYIAATANRYPAQQRAA